MNNAKRLEQFTDQSTNLEVLVENHEIEPGKPYIHCEVSMILDNTDPILSFAKQLRYLAHQGFKMSEDESGEPKA